MMAPKKNKRRKRGMQISAQFVFTPSSILQIGLDWFSLVWYFGHPNIFEIFTCQAKSYKTNHVLGMFGDFFYAYIN